MEKAIDAAGGAQVHLGKEGPAENHRVHIVAVLGHNCKTILKNQVHFFDST
jgi:hypothetical protein